jgi:hypothetical protein
MTALTYLHQAEHASAWNKQIGNSAFAIVSPKASRPPEATSGLPIH